MMNSYQFVWPMYKLFINTRTFQAANLAFSRVAGRGGCEGQGGVWGGVRRTMSNLQGDKEVVLLHLSQCKHHTTGTPDAQATGEWMGWN